MIDIRVEGLDRLQRQLRGFERQIPFATSVALNNVAFKVKAQEQQEMRASFDRIKPWVVRQVFVKKSTKADLVAVIGSPTAAKSGVPGKLDDVLRPHVFGGDRVQRKAERMLASMGLMPAGYKAVPGPDVDTDQYGNIPLRTWKEFIQIHRGGELFATLGDTPRTRHLAPGIYWRRYNYHRRRSGRRHRYRRNNFQYATRIECLILFVPLTRYSRRLQWFETARRVVVREMPGAFEEASRKALGTAR